MKTGFSFLQSKPAAFILLAIAFVLIYNPFTKFPFTFVVISAFILGVTYLAYGNLRNLQFKKLKSKDFIIIILLYVTLEVVMDFAVQPFINKLLNEPADYSGFDSLKGNFPKYLKYLLFMWISAAFGEELLFRAFSFVQLRKIFRNNKFILVLLSAVLFSLPHLYQGIPGLVMTFIFGIAFGLIYIRYNNIWINIIVHGLIDTVFMTLAYLGMLSFYS